MAQHSGFFNAMESGGVYDRTYNADDYTSNLAAIISTGVRRSSEDDLKVTASGLNVSVNVGRAWIDGRWYYNDTVLALQTVTPPTGALARKDGVYLQANSNTAVRSIQLVYKTGTPASTPTAPACVRSGGIYEIQLATITVQPNAEGVTVTDTRANKTLCGWITTPVGYDDFFASYDNEFTEWFDETKDTLASVTLFKQYLWSTTTSGTSTTSVTFSIPQYDSTGTDIINVYVNGLLQTPTTDYTLSGSTITFTAGKTAGTKIIVMCYKSIDGSDLGDVSDEITALQNQVATLGDVGEYYYFCNGSTDNEDISTAVQTFLAGSTTDGRKMKLHIVGNFGVTTAAAGSGTASVHYRWFNFYAADTNRQVTLDFYNAKPITITCASSSYNCIFYGKNVNIEGLALTVNAPLHCLGIEGNDSRTKFTDCKISITASFGSGVISFASAGIFRDNEITVTNALGAAAVYALNANNSLIQIFGGVALAYTGVSNGLGSAVFAVSSLTGAAVSVFGARFPTKAKTNFYQSNSVYMTSGTISAYGIITALWISTTGTSIVSISGTISNGNI